MADDKNRDKTNLLLLFQKPLEPIFTAKDDGMTSFHIPQEYLTERYRPIGMELASRIQTDNTVDLKPLTTYPDLAFTSALSLNSGFSLFNQAHKEMAGKLMQIFLDQPDASTLLSVAAYIKDRVNVYMFQYALTVALQHRSDTKDMDLPSVVNLFPDQFVDPTAFPRAREESALVSQESRQHINIPMEFTSNEKEVEQRMAYFREGNFKLGLLH